MEEAITCQAITKIYGEGPTKVEALKGIDLKVAVGQLLMIVGPSGSGKTTLISVLAGILNPTTGQCSVLGQNLKDLSNEMLTAFRGKNIGFVFQAFNLVPMLTAAENVAVPLLLNGEEYERAVQKAKEILCSYGLEDKVDTLPANLSGGQQQRVAIARSCVHEPKVIVCDEPTSSLDHETGAKVMELLQSQAKEQHRTLIIVTHDPRIFSYADQIVKIEDGKIAAS